MLSLINQFKSISTNVKNIIFDYDGTIAQIPINWKAVREACFNHLRKRYSVLPILDTQRVDEMEALALSLYPDDAKYIFAFREKIESNCHLNHIPISCVISLVKEIHSDYNCFIVSNNLFGTIMRGLADLGLEHCFKCVLGVDTVGIPKPNIQSVVLLQDKFAIDIKHTVMLGDSPSTDGKYCELLNIPFLNITQFI